MCDEDLSNFLKSLDNHFVLQGLHLDLKNTKVTEHGILDLTSFIEKCPNIVSAAFDLSNLNLNEIAITNLIGKLENKPYLRDLCISLYGNDLSNGESIKSTTSLVRNASKSLEFLRLSFGNSKINKLDIVELCTHLNDLKDLTG